MEYARGAATTRIAEGLLAAGCAGIELGALTYNNAAGLTVDGASSIQRPHLWRTRGVLCAGGVRETLDLFEKEEIREILLVSNSSYHADELLALTLLH